MTNCIQCGDQARNKRSSLCQACFDRYFMEMLDWELVEVREKRVKNVDKEENQ